MPTVNEDEVLEELSRVWTTLGNVAMRHRENAGLWATFDHLVSLIGILEGRQRDPAMRIEKLPRMFEEHVRPLHPALAEEGNLAALRAIEMLRTRGVL